MMKYMKYLMPVIVLLFSCFASAQQSVNVDDPNNRMVNISGINGEPFITTKYMRVVEGSVFIPAEFANASILLKDNKRPITNVKARINVAEHTLHYLNENGDEFFTRLPIEKIFFTDVLNTNPKVYTQAPENCQNAKQGWYEVLEKGKLILYCEIIKTIRENNPYGSATIEQTVQTNYKYWIQAGSSCTPVNKITDIIATLEKLSPGFQGSLGTQKFSDKKQQDWL